MITNQPPKEEGVESLAQYFTNGDLKALREVIAKYHLKNEEAALKFALGIVLNAEENMIFLRKDGGMVRALPQDELLATQDGTN